jgi:hypothetical protein
MIHFSLQADQTNLEHKWTKTTTTTKLKKQVESENQNK